MSTEERNGEPPILLSLQSQSDTALPKGDASYACAGSTWQIPLSLLEDAGAEALTDGRVGALDLTVANEICGSPTPLVGSELEFLCELTKTSFTEVADRLATSKSNITYWRKENRELTLHDSLHLKKWFWSKLFATLVPTRAVAAAFQADGAWPEVFFDERALLPRMRELAIEAKLALPQLQRRCAEVRA